MLVHNRFHLAVMATFVAAMIHGCGGSDSPAPPAKDAPKTDAKADAPKADREGWPTEEEAKAAIFKVEHDIHASQTKKDVWKVKDFKHEVKSVKFGQKTLQKQMNFGASAITVYPVKIIYTQVTDYEHKEATRVETGANGVWFLYRDSFGEWTGKFGSE